MKAFPTFLFFFCCVLSFTVRAHFALAPKIEIAPPVFEQPEKVLIRFDQYSINRVEFADYLQRVSAFDTKYDRVQSSFFSHFEVIRGIAFFHPENVHKYIDRMSSSNNQVAVKPASLTTWFTQQAEVFARIKYFSEKGKKTQLENHDSQAVMNFYAAAAKTEFLEELVVLGSMTPNASGLKKYVASFPNNERSHIPTGIVNDTEITPLDEQKKMKKRWADFRHQILQDNLGKNYCKQVISSDSSKDAVFVKVNQHTVSLADYLAIFGTPRLERQWNAVTKMNCNRMVLFYAMADLADQLGIVPERVSTKIRVSQQLFLAAKQIVKELGPTLVNKEESNNYQTMLQKLMVYPEVVKLKERLLMENQGLFSSGSWWIDDQFFADVPWRLKRTMAPKHSIHF